VLSKRNYPTIISTKGELAADLAYVALLQRNPNTIVQVSLVSTSDRAAKLIEPNATPNQTAPGNGGTEQGRGDSDLPTAALSARGGRSNKKLRGYSRLSRRETNLKVPIERGSNPIIEAARDSYLKLGARRDGREYVLPASIKRAALFELQKECRRARIYFGSADNDFQFLSDSWACCSGADLFPGFENYYRFQIAYAVRRSVGRDIRLSIINGEWRPSGSIDRYLNSKTRMSFRLGITGTVDAHIRYRWNSLAAPGSPTSFAGVIATDEFDEAGNRIYRWGGGCR
jgi:hypothetical protein